MTNSKPHLFFLFFLFSLFIYAQEFNNKAYLKDYAKDLVITTQVRGERNKAILRGTEAEKNRDFVLKNYTGIQPSIYPAWDYGFWPKEKPRSISKIKIETDGLNELVNWGELNNFHIIHHCLFFPNKYFPKWFSKTYSKGKPRKVQQINIS